VTEGFESERHNVRVLHFGSEFICQKTEIRLGNETHGVGYMVDGIRLYEDFINFLYINCRVVPDT
jgi:hypothetical protein